MATKGIRVERVGQSLREIIGTQLLQEARDPALQWVSITDVVVSRDVRNATVFFSLLSHEQTDVKRVGRALERAAPFFQRNVAEKLRLRHTPVLKFKYDDTVPRSARVDELVCAIQMERKARDESMTPVTRLGQMVADCSSFAVVTHARPDGDALGSLLGIGRCLRQLGKEVALVAPEGVPDGLLFLPGSDEVNDHWPALLNPDLVIFVDVASKKQVPDAVLTLPEEKRVVVDHHRVSDLEGGLVFRDPSAAATAEVLFGLARSLGWPVDAASATAFYAAIVADSGSFRYANTCANTMRVAAELLELGVDAARVAYELFDRNPLARQRLLALVAATLQVSDDGRVAMLHCTLQMLETAQATSAMLDGMVNIARTIDGVVAAGLLVEVKGGVKASLRSNGEFDVSEVAASLGGGGHRNAAAVRFPDSELSVVRQRLFDALGAAVTAA